MTLESYDAKSVREKLLAIRAEKRCGPHEAVREFLSGLTDEQAVKLMRGPFGEGALLEVERDALRVGPRYTAPVPANYGVNRRSLALAGRKAWDCEVAIGNTGQRKRLGDLTEEDCTVISGQAKAAAATLDAQARGWRAIGRKLAKGETLEQAAARLSDTDREFLAREVGAKELAA